MFEANLNPSNQQTFYWTYFLLGMPGISWLNISLQDMWNNNLMNFIIYTWSVAVLAMMLIRLVELFSSHTRITLNNFKQNLKLWVTLITLINLHVTSAWTLITVQYQITVSYSKCYFPITFLSFLFIHLLFLLYHGLKNMYSLLLFLSVFFKCFVKYTWSNKSPNMVRLNYCYLVVLERTLAKAVWHNASILNSPSKTSTFFTMVNQGSSVINVIKVDFADIYTKAMLIAWTENDFFLIVEVITILLWFPLVFNSNAFTFIDITLQM